jgi:hypothetical protein
MQDLMQSSPQLWPCVHGPHPPCNAPNRCIRTTGCYTNFHRAHTVKPSCNCYTDLDVTRRKHRRFGEPVTGSLGKSNTQSTKLPPTLHLQKKQQNHPLQYALRS